jgi:hypothetical protein
MRQSKRKPYLELSRVFGDKVAIVAGSDFPDSDVLPGVLYVLFVEAHGLTINPTCPMNEDGWVETHDERHIAGKVLELVWLVAINLQHSDGHARGNGGGCGE